MKLITEVSIRGFRSLRQQELPRIGSYTTLVGKNSSGKSNVLRALNLFFNNRIEPDKPLDFLRDTFGYLLAEKGFKILKYQLVT